MNSSGNGDGGPEGGLPDLPPDWGSVIIPDDPAELAAEAAALRRELRRRARSARWRRRLGRPPAPGRPGAPGWRVLRRRRDLPRLPLLLLLIAVLATLTSLFAVIRTNPTRQPGGRTSSPAVGTGDAGSGGLVGGSAGAGTVPASTLPALDLVGERGELISLRSLLPALILVVDGCDCASRIDAAALAAPAEVTVVALASGRVTPGPVVGRADTARQVRRLVDPAGELRSSLRLGTPDGTPTAVLVGRSARIVRTVPDSTDPARDYGRDLPELVKD
ncbi:hypothetical protein ACFFWC_31330 [Plantactinospora siamensis]|uniref:Uncharacterized protein n=1 Tax=Plantactinospora siamensis TaxID=555372 RepID=A0ABV6P683_9ACTN